MNLKINKDSFFHILVTVFIASYYLFGMVFGKAGGIFFNLLVLLGLISCTVYYKKNAAEIRDVLKKYWLLHISMLLPVLAVFVNHMILQNFSAREYERPLQFVFFPLLMVLFYQIPQHNLRKVFYIFPICTVIIVVQTYIFTEGGTVRGAGIFMPAIIYTDLAMLIGVLAILSVRLSTDIQNRYLNNGLKIFGVTAVFLGAYAGYLYKTRTVWLGVPLFVFLILTTFLERKHFNKNNIIKTVLVAGFLVFMAGLYISSHGISSRITEGKNDIQKYTSGGEVNTSLGIRFQLWKSAFVILKENPEGISRSNFYTEHMKLAERGIVRPEIAVSEHSHSDILFNGVISGLMGIIAILGVYFVPACYFLKRWKTRIKDEKIIVKMGLALTLGYFFFGLVDTLFVWKACATFYTLTLALLITMLMKEHDKNKAAYAP